MAIQVDFVPVNPPRIVLDERMQELIVESGEDNARTGFENLGSPSSIIDRRSIPLDYKLNGQAGNDRLITGGGDDVMFGGSGNDQLFSFRGNDVLNGGSGRDTLWGGEDDDTLSGGSGNDELTGGTGDDLLIGGTGDDILIGDTSSFDELGRDVLKGGYGNDSLTGGGSGDVLTGGAGADTFVFHQGNSNLDDRDHITDFTGLDRIDISMIDIGGTSDPAAAQAPYTFVEYESTQAGTVWVSGKQNEWHVFVNHDGGAPDMAINVTIAGGLTALTEDHFLL